MLDFTASLRQVGIRQRSLRRHCRLGRATELVFVLATGATLVLTGQAQAQTVWDGSTSADWTDASNWDGGAVPTGSDDVVINAGADNNPELPISPPGAAQSVLINGGSLTLRSGLGATGGLSTDGTGIVIITGDMSGSDNAGVFTGNVVQGSSGTSSLQGEIVGVLTVNAGSFTVQNGGTVTGSTILNDGQLTIAPGGNLGSGQTLTVNGGNVSVGTGLNVGTLNGTGGTIGIDPVYSLNISAGDYAGVITNGGQVFKIGPDTLVLSGANMFSRGGPAFSTRLQPN